MRTMCPLHWGAVYQGRAADADSAGAARGATGPAAATGGDPTISAARSTMAPARSTPRPLGLADPGNSGTSKTRGPPGASSMSTAQTSRPMTRAAATAPRSAAGSSTAPSNLAPCPRLRERRPTRVAGAGPPRPARRPRRRAGRRRAARGRTAAPRVLAQPEDGLQRRLERLPRLADDDPGLLVPRRKLHEHGNPPTWRTISRNPEGSDAITVREQRRRSPRAAASTRILFRDRRWPARRSGPPARAAGGGSHRQPVLAERRAPIRGHTTSVAGNAPPCGRSPALPGQPHLHWSGSTTRATCPRPRAGLDDPPGVKIPPRGEDGQVHRADGKGACRRFARERKGGT